MPPLSLWGLDEARKNFNERVDKTGSAAWNTARGRKPKDDPPPPRRTSASTTSSTSPAPVKRDYLPPPRKLSQQEMPPPPKTHSANAYAEAKTKRPPPPPLPSREGSFSASGTPPLPRRSTSSVVSSVDSETSSIRPSALLDRAPSFPATIKRNEGQDGVTNELAEKLAKMRTRSISPGQRVSSDVPKSASVPVTPRLPSTETVPKLDSRPVPPKPVSAARTPVPVNATKPSLPPRTTPAPPRIPALKPAPQSFKPIPLPYQAPSLHRAILPGFNYPTPEANCNSPGLDKFNRVFPRPLWEIEQASLFILAILYPSDSTYTFTPKLLEQPIQLIMRDMGGNAHAENSSVIITQGRNKEVKYRSNIVFSTRNLTEVAKRDDAAFVEEVRGVIVHELTHSWQWDCSNVPGGLTEGQYPPVFSDL